MTRLLILGVSVHSWRQNVGYGGQDLFENFFSPTGITKIKRDIVFAASLYL